MDKDKINSYTERYKSRSHAQLYALYDKSTDEDEKEAIKGLVDSLDILEVDDDFMEYPGFYDSELNEKVFQKKEFHINKLLLDTTGLEDKCDRSDFSIEGHQNFLKNFMTKESPYLSLLLFHGVGVGKTCSALTIAENFRDIYARKDKRILIISSKNIQIGWKKSIYDPDKKDNQCTGKVFVDSGAESDRQVNKLVKKYYEMMAYQSFANYVRRMIDMGTNHLSEDKRFAGKIKIIKEYFSNRLMIIDEVHNIRDEDNADMRDTIKMIRLVIEHSDNFRLLLLSATPMYNRSVEVVWMINMMLLNDKRPLLSKKDIFDSKGSITNSGKQLLQEKCRGYVSYLRGENPMTFPSRMYPSDIRVHKRMLYGKYTESRKDNELIIKRLKAPSKNISGSVIKKEEALTFLTLFGSRLMENEHQLQVYRMAIESSLRSIPDEELSRRGEVNPILESIMLKQISNISYPSKNEVDINNIDEFYGEKALQNTFHIRRHGNSDEYEYRKHILDEYGPLFDRDIIRKYSTKIASIIDSIDKSEGIVFIYSEYISSGIVPMMLALEQNGYKKYSGRRALKYPEWTKRSNDTSTKREPISYDGEVRSKAGSSFIQGKYMVIAGNTNDKELRDQLKIVTSNQNSDGSKIKVILGSVVASEGLDFKCIRAVHIMEPWLHLNRLEQTIGRAIRFCSHKTLPPEKRNVTVYLHTTFLPKGQESVDTQIYRYAEKKAIQIGEVELILKQNAVDRYIFKDVNVISSSDIQSIEVKPAFYEGRSFFPSPHDKPRTKVCSFLPTCDYNTDLDTPDYDKLFAIDFDELNEDTFIESYSVNNVQTIIKRISLLYVDTVAYDISSIVEILSEYGYNHDNIIYQAMTEMIEGKHILSCKGQTGTIIQHGNYYVFQPFLVNDQRIPLYYRINDISHREDHIILERHEKVVKDFICEELYLNEDIDKGYDELDTQHPMLDTIIDSLCTVYEDLDEEHEAYIGYILSRISLHDKCKLLYGLLTPDYNSRYTYHKMIENILLHNVIYSKGGSYFLYESIDKSTLKEYTPFGFFISFDSTPIFWEYIDGKIKKCHKIHMINIQKMIVAYKDSETYGELYRDTPPLWGYLIHKDEGGISDTFLKIVHNTKRSSYPPGPGSICMSEGHGVKLKDVMLLLRKNFKEVYELFLGHSDTKFKDKGSLCCLFELLLRYQTYTEGYNTFYTYDSIWLKY